MSCMSTVRVHDVHDRKFRHTQTQDPASAYYVGHILPFGAVVQVPYT